MSQRQPCERRRAGRMRRLAAGLWEWLACHRGTSAVEFALFAPVLAFCLLAGFDLGMGISQRMALDHVLRSGAQSAMADPGVPAVQNTATSVATLSFAGSPPTLSISRFCACPETADTAVTCSTSCAGSEPTFTFYRLEAQMSYEGNLMPSFNISRMLQVQVR